MFQVNEGLSPSQDEIAWAKEFSPNSNVTGRDPHRSDLPRIARATKTSTWPCLGIEVSDFDDEQVHSPAPSDTYHY
jgi:citrate lyase subunit beta/citryl-CoA lyase